MKFNDKPQGPHLDVEECLRTARLFRDMAAYPGNHPYQSVLRDLAKSWEERAAALGKGQRSE